MIRLRKQMERAARHPLFGPICLLLFALLMAFVVLHVTHDAAHAHEAGDLICVAFAIGVVIWRLGTPSPRPSIEYVILDRALPPPHVHAEPLSRSTRGRPAPVPLLL
jgi:hypothetical protein